MDMKTEKKKIGLMLLLILILSTLVYSVYYFPIESLPKERIAKDLGREQQNLIIRNGFILVNFYYNDNCKNCKNLKMFLEELISKKEFEEVYLNLITSNFDHPIIIISSLRGTEKFEDSSEEEIKRKICELMISPPIECFI